MERMGGETGRKKKNKLKKKQEVKDSERKDPAREGQAEKAETWRENDRQTGSTLRETCLSPV